jgi:protein involved in polysaccharide export with SLBB domain
MDAHPAFLALSARSHHYPAIAHVLLIATLLAAGCQAPCPHMDRELMAGRSVLPQPSGSAQDYTLGCPDMLEITVTSRPDLTGRMAIGPDGQIDLGDEGTVRVEGHTAAAAAAYVAERLGLLDGEVRLRVAEFNSRQIYLSGSGTGVPRTVPYRGPETVLDLLRRVGGVTPGVAPEDVYVVRPHVSEGERPEVFHIDLPGIVMHQDSRTNLMLQPFDQVYVGETRQGKLEKCLPGWLRPVYRTLWGIRPQEPPLHPG